MSDTEADTLPPREEQLGIAAHVKHSLQRYDDYIRIVRSSIKSHREYRTALISAAVTGKIDVREEP
jgi:type I restriction enzyme, S subunit